MLRRSPARGFTLVEVMVALAVLAIALTAIANSLGGVDADLRDRSLEAVKRAIAEVKSRTLDAPQDQKESP